MQTCIFACLCLASVVSADEPRDEKADVKRVNNDMKEAVSCTKTLVGETNYLFKHWDHDIYKAFDKKLKSLPSKSEKTDYARKFMDHIYQDEWCAELDTIRKQGQTCVDALYKLGRHFGYQKMARHLSERQVKEFQDIHKHTCHGGNDEPYNPLTWRKTKGYGACKMYRVCLKPWATPIENEHFTAEDALDGSSKEDINEFKAAERKFDGVPELAEWRLGDEPDAMHDMSALVMYGFPALLFLGCVAFAWRRQRRVSTGQASLSLTHERDCECEVAE